MGVVIVQSRATAHVYRVFGALIALLLMMALAVGLMRLRSDRPVASPYGALGGVGTTREASAVSATIAAQTPVSVPSAPVPQAPPLSVPAIVASQALPVAVPPGVATPPPAAVAPQPAATPVAKAPADEARVSPPRQIALDKLAAGPGVSQPAPPAVIEAARRVAAAPPAAPADMVRPAATPPHPVAKAADGQAALTTKVKDDASSGRVNINTASVDQLNSLGGGHIGRTIARHRPYRSLEDLVGHRVLKARDFARIRSAISID